MVEFFVIVYVVGSVLSETLSVFTASLSSQRLVGVDQDPADVEVCIAEFGVEYQAAEALVGDVPPPN